MILPGSYITVLILLLLGMVGWGVWANTFKAAGDKWRFELFYFDFAIGVLLAATVVALTAGSLGFDGFSFADDLQLAGKRQDLFGFLSGAIFNLGNMLLLGAVSIGGIALAFPVGMGFALIIAACWNFALSPADNTAILFAGAGIVAVAIVFDVLAYKTWFAEQLGLPAVQGRPKLKKSVSTRAVFLSLAGGLMLGSFSPLVQMGRTGENALGPYSIGFIFAIGVVFSTFVYNLFFMNLPVQGQPVEMAVYFRAKLRRHALGMLGGMLWYAGLIGSLINGRMEGAAQVSARIGFALNQSSIVIAALCGLFLWHEMESTESQVKSRVGIALVLLVAGIGLSTFALAPAR